MTMQSNNPNRSSGFLHSVKGQVAITIIVIAIVIILAWRYVF